MEALEFWKLNEFFTVRDISLLIIDEDPSDYGSHDNDWLGMHRKGFLPISNALKKAVEQGKIKAKIFYVENEYGVIDWHITELEVESIKDWLKSKNLKTDFFYDFDKEMEDDCTFPFSHFYAPKLSAAVSAWRAVTKDTKRLHGKTPKQAIEIWLKENASSYDLIKEDGAINSSAIEEISKIANWKPEGGAAKTPTQVQTNLPSPRTKKVQKTIQLPNDVPLSSR